MDLLAGPRGRRLVLEFARSSEERAGGADLHDAVWRAEWLFDPEPSSSVVLSAAQFGDDPSPVAVPDAPPDARWAYAPLPGGGRIDEPVPPREGADAAAREVAGRLDALRLDGVSWETLRDPLMMMIGFARYWQFPDGVDVLLEAEPLRGALARVADHVATSPAVAWWGSGVAERAQWAMVWEGADPVPPLDPARGSLAEAREHVIEWEARARRDRPADSRASFSGEWWSSPRWPVTGPQTTRLMPESVPLQAALVEDDFGWDEGEAQRLGVPAGLRIFEIDGADAWAELCRSFPIDVTAQKRHDWYRTTGRSGAWTMPDWAAVAGEYDAVHLQVGAYLAAAGTAIEVDGERSSVIAGWDPDATFWFTDRVRYVGERIRCVRRERGTQQVWERATG